MNASGQPAEGGYLLGLDLGGTRLKVLALDPAGIEIRRETVPTDGPDWKANVLECVSGFSTRLGHPMAVGVAAAGLPSADGKSIAFMPGRLPGLEGLTWTGFLQSPLPVPVLNDAHAALLGEFWMGAARGMRDVILLTLGTGVGGAILSDGNLLRGHIGRAGHFGHISINAHGPPDLVNTPGSLEDAIGNQSIRSRSGGRYSATADLVADVTGGDPTASAIWNRMIRDLAVGISSLINVLDPEAVLIGGGIAAAGDALFRPLSAELDRIEWRPDGHQVKILSTRLGDWAGAYGAAFHALSHHDTHR